MTTPPVLPYAPYSTPALEPPDRSGLLIGVGVCEILMAVGAFGFSALATLGAIIGAKAPSGAQNNPAAVMKGVAVFMLSAVFFLVMGIATIQAKRWARALMNAICWLWFVFGIMMSLLMAAVLPRTLNAGAHMSRTVVMIATFVVCLLIAVLMIVVPGVLVMIYRSPAVKATCERKNPAASWTDRFATGPLALFLVISFAMVVDLTVGFSKPLFPMFGVYLTNWPGRIGFILVAMWRMFLAWDCFYLRLRGWRNALITYVLLFVSAAITYVRADVAEAYRRIGMSPREIAAAAAMMRNPAFVAVQLGVVLAVVVFIVAVRKYYSQGGEVQVSSFGGGRDSSSLRSSE